MNISFFYKLLKRSVWWIFLSALVGVLSGVAATAFLFFINSVTDFRNDHVTIIFFLPLAGLFIGVVYHYLGTQISTGNTLIFEEIHNPKNHVPFRMVPFIFFGSILTHLFGGATGREGAMVQMGSALSDQIASLLKIEKEERKILLVAGVSAGFSAALGTPWAGLVFGMEVIHIGKLNLFSWFECLIASFAAYGVTIFLQAPHAVYPLLAPITYEWRTVIVVSLLGILSGFAAFYFIRATHLVEIVLHKFIKYPPFRTFLGGLFLLLFYWWEGTYQYVGLGITFIQQAFTTPTELQVPLLKGLFTVLSVGSGFKGGEFIPLVFIGTTLGSSLSVFFQVSTHLFAALGFAAVFAGAANTPITCTVMAMEIFGWEIGGYALIACFASYYFSGTSGIYKAQKTLRGKHHRFLYLWNLLGQLPKRFL